jgi:DNA-binding SARP family transcriptional activator
MGRGFWGESVTPEGARGGHLVSSSSAGALQANGELDDPYTPGGPAAGEIRPRKAAAQPGMGPRVGLLGGFELSLEGKAVALPMTAQRLVAFLALRDRPLLRLHVAGTLWPDATEARAGANLRSALWRLGRPGFQLVDVSNGHLALGRGVDVDFHRASDLARRLLDQSSIAEHGVVDELSLAKDMLPDWSDDWVIVEREHFRQLRLHALESLCERLTSLQRFSEAIEAGLAAVAAEPLRESAHRALIKAHLAEGNVGEAAHQYRVFQTLLRNELDLEPSSLMEDIMKGLRRVLAFGSGVAISFCTYVALGGEELVTMG